MNEETPGEVTRRLDTASFVLAQLREKHIPWGDPGDGAAEERCVTPENDDHDGH